MTREDMWEEFESQLISEVRTPITMSYDDSIRAAERGIKEVVKRWKKRLEKEPCEDAISRQAVLDEVFEVDTKEYGRIDVVGVDAIDALPSVNPQQKTGHWIKYGIPRCDEQHYKCTACGYYINFGQWGELYTKQFKYCPNCGARMVGE